MKEIGGFIEYERYDGELLHKDAVKLNSGRNGLAYLIKAKGIRKIALPIFLCDCIEDICCQYGVEVRHYLIDEFFLPKDISLQGDEWLFVVNYYGQHRREMILSLQKRYERIILDNTHAYFDMPIEGIDTLYTCRKYFGVPDGGFLYTDKRIDIPQMDLSFDRLSFLAGRFECGASDFYSLYHDNEAHFYHAPIKRMSTLTENILRSLDYGSIKHKRTDNFTFLHEHLGAINGLKLRAPEGAFMYPLYIENGEKLRKRLISQKLFIPRLWPNVVDVAEKGSLEWRFALNILPIPCDQRYTIDDMAYIVRLIGDEYQFIRK